jgi:hypothetical protein
MIKLEPNTFLSNLVFYTVPPEKVLIDFLRLHIASLFMEYDIVVSPGHPIFMDEVVQNPKGDRNFPRIGVEWVRDHRINSVGQNQSGKFRPNDNFRKLVNELRNLDIGRRFASEEVLNRMSQAKVLEMFVHTVKSEIVIAGFATGNKGRMFALEMYQGIDAILSGIMADIQSSYQGVSCFTADSHETNIYSDQYGFPLWGFEIPIFIVQNRATIREIPKYLFPDNSIIDIFLRGTRPDLNWE